MKRLFSLLLVLCVLCVNVLAAETGYTGKIDIQTGEKIDESGLGDAERNRVVLTDEIAYNSEERLYYYSCEGNSTEFTADVCSGMIVTSPVTITLPVGYNAKLYKDGKEVRDPAWGKISEPGNYTVSVAGGNGMSYQPLNFQIVHEITGDLTGFKLPNGFILATVKLDGEEIAFENSYYVEMTEEGRYSICYRCPKTGVVYTLNVTTDHIAPTLEFEGMEKGVAKGPVKIIKTEEDSTVTVTFEGEETSYSQKLTEIGDYVVTVTDPAGNYTQYPFTIQMYFNTNSIIFAVLILALVAGVLIYLFISRKRLRVR